MAFVTVQPSRADITIANAIASHTSPRIEKAAKAATWGADERVLCALAAGWWLYSRYTSAKQRRMSDHLLVSTVASSVLPHILKQVFDQERPDRVIVPERRNGIPLSGKPFDAFPSGHALHIGAIASAADVLPVRQRNIVWTIGGALALTRIVLLAHWTSDVIASLVMGVGIECILRRATGYGDKTTS